MAKIADLVKTYRMLSDPNAPDWNVKFIGAIAIAGAIVAGGVGALLWSATQDAPTSAPAASVTEPADDPRVEECALPADAPRPPTLSRECADASAVLP